MLPRFIHVVLRDFLKNREPGLFYVPPPLPGRALLSLLSSSPPAPPPPSPSFIQAGARAAVLQALEKGRKREHRPGGAEARPPLWQGEIVTAELEAAAPWGRERPWSTVGWKGMEGKWG